MLIRYNSIAELRSAAIELNAAGGCCNQSPDSWCGETQTQTMLRSELGDQSLVPEAERLIQELNLEIQTPRRVWVPSPAGAFPVIPDHIRGLPGSMRRLTHSTDEWAPITVLVITTSSAAITAETLRRRGTTILALVMALTPIRPVSLHIVSTTGGDVDGTGETIIAAEINTHPLDLATACYVLSSAGFTRRLCYGIAWRKANFTNGWPRKYYEDRNAWYKYLTQLLSADPARTLLIRDCYLTDPLLTEPVKWLNDQIQRMTESTDENVA